MKDSTGKLLLDPPSFFLIPTVPIELEKLIDSIDGKKSYGPMSLPVKLLKLYKGFFFFLVEQSSKYVL